MFKKILGAIDLLISIIILGWVGYNYLIEMQPAAEGLNPIPALLFAGAGIYFGIKWLTEKKGDSTPK